MAIDQGHAQPPPTDLATRKIPLIKASALSEKTWHRIGKSTRDPLYYTNDSGWRFSRKDMRGTLYLGATIDTCFWEVFWDDLATRPPEERRIDAGKVLERSAWTASVPKGLTLVNTLDAQGMIDLGAHGGTFNGPYAICQEWAKALREHPMKPHGILYGSARNVGSKCLALFQEYEGTFAPSFSNQTPLSNHSGLAAILTQNGFPPALVDKI